MHNCYICRHFGIQFQFVYLSIAEHPVNGPFFPHQLFLKSSTDDHTTGGSGETFPTRILTVEIYWGIFPVKNQFSPDVELSSSMLIFFHKMCENVGCPKL